MTAPPEENRKTSIQERFPRALVVRLFVYLFGGHLFAFFLWLLFTLGDQG